MLNPNVSSIIYQSEIYYRNLINKLTDGRRLGKSYDIDWQKADIILGYLEVLGSRDLLTSTTDIDNLNYILECLIKLCELNQYPSNPPITFQPAPAVIVGEKGDPGDPGTTGPRGYTGLATDFSFISTLVTVVVDSFPITDAKAARWDYVVTENGGALRASSIIGEWTSDGLSFDLVDNGADDLVSDTSGIEFDISISGSTVQLIAVITSGTWSIWGSRYYIPNNGNGSGPITNVLPLGQVYIGNSSNQAIAQSVTGVLQLAPSGITSFTPNIIQNADISATADIALTKLTSLNNNIVPITNGSGKLISSTLNPTTLSYIDIGSSLTTLLSLKLTDPLTTVGDLLIRNGSNITARLAIGTVNQVLTIVGGVPAWQNVPGGISGLTTGFIPKASSATTLANSIISETTGAITIAGTAEIQGGLRTESAGPYYKTKIIDIGDWNMDTTASVVLGFLGVGVKVRTISIIIRDDNLVVPVYNNLEKYDVTTGLAGYFQFEPTVNFGTLTLTRLATSFFDSTNYDSTSYNRGWITITYEA